MNNKQISVLVLLYLIFTGIFIKGRISEYQSWKKYNGMKGTVIDVYENSGRYSSSLTLTIKLDDGSIGRIHDVNENWSIGETFINEIPYNMIFGVSYVGGSIDPNRSGYSMIYNMIYVLIHIVLIISFLLSLFVEWFDKLGKKDNE